VNKYKVIWCPICRQGWVEIVKERKTGMLFLCCDECEAEWTNPDAIDANNGTRFKFGEVIEPTVEDIELMDWLRYVQPES